MSPKAFRLSAAAGLLLVLGCSNPEDQGKVPLPETNNADLVPDVHRPITQVRQTLNLTPTEAMRLTIDSLRRREVSIASLDEPNGVIETDWVTVEDSVCSGHRVSNAPLSCRVRLSFKIEAFPKTASVLNVRYKELCSFNEEINLECPDSSAEKLMISIVNDVKAQDAEMYPPSRWRKIFN